MSGAARTSCRDRSPLLGAAVAVTIKSIDRVSPSAAAVALGCAVIFAPLCIPLVTQRIFTLDDLTWFHLPIRFLYRAALLHGTSFLWTPELNNGLFLHAEGQAGMAHPFHLALYRLSPLWAAMNIEMLSSYVLAFAGMIGFLRRCSLKTEAALAGAMAFAFSGFNVMHLSHLNAVAIVAHVPWLLWSADLVLSSRSSRGLAAGVGGVALVLGSQLLLGYPQYVWMAGLALVWFIAYRLWCGIPAHRAALLAFALVCGVLIGSVQLVPTLDAARSTFRAETPFEFRLLFSLHPLNVMQLWSPFVFAQRTYSPVSGGEAAVPHEFALYDGGLATVALVWVMLRWRARRHREFSAALLILTLAGMMLAFGRYGGAYPVLARLPGIASFRAPARHIALVHFAFAALAALVIDDLLELARRGLRLDWRDLWPLAIPLALSIATLVAAHVLTGSTWASNHNLHLSSPPRLIGGVVAIATPVILVALAARGSSVAVPVLVIATAVDLAAWGVKYVWFGRPTTIQSKTASIAVPPGAGPGDYVFPPISPDERNVFVLAGLRPTMAYVGLEPPQVLAANDPIAQRIAGAKWAWGPAGWSAVRNSMPRARLVADVRVSSHVAADVRVIDIARTAVLEAPLDQLLSGIAGRATLIEDSPGRLVVDSETNGAQLLVITERFHSGWTATEDGHATVVRAAYGDFLACIVSGGRHTVTFTFDPASVRRGLWLTLSGVLLTATGIAWLFSSRHGHEESRAATLDAQTGV